MAQRNYLDKLIVSFDEMYALVKSYENKNAKLKESLLLCEKQIHNYKQTIACDLKIKEELNDKIICLEKKVCEKNNCVSCVILNDKIACLEKISCDNIVCTKCDILENEIACLKAKCESHEKDNVLANTFQNSNDKVLKMLNMSNHINCRKGIGSNTCVDTCSCIQIKKVVEIPKFIETRKPKFVVTNNVQKPPYVPKMKNVNYVPRKSHAFMYNNKFVNPKKSDKPHAHMYNRKFSKPRNDVNPHSSFYVYDQYNRKIKMVKKWIPKGMFSVNNPGGMRLWF